VSEEIQIPKSLIKLETLKIRHITYFAARRELQDRVNELRSRISDFRARRNELARFVPSSAPQMMAPGTQATWMQIEAIDRSIAALVAMLEVASSALEENEAAGVEDARLYEATQRHLLGELRAWGLE
jgi:hypothetical protein